MVDAGFGRSVGVFAITAIGIATTVARLGFNGGGLLGTGCIALAVRLG